MPPWELVQVVSDRRETGDRDVRRELAALWGPALPS